MAQVVDIQEDTATNEAAAAPKPAPKLVALPVAKLVASSLLIGAVIGLMAWPAFRVVYPVGVGGVPLGVLGGVGGVLMGVLVLQPWRAREVRKWAILLLAGQGIGFFATLILDLLLYSSTRCDPVALALVSAGAFSGAAIGQVRVFAGVTRSLVGQGG